MAMGAACCRHFPEAAADRAAVWDAAKGAVDRAARLGCALPLPVALDLAAAVGLSRGRYSVRARSGDPDYSAWMARLSEAIERADVAAGAADAYHRDDGATPANGSLDVVPIAVRAWRQRGKLLAPPHGVADYVTELNRVSAASLFSHWERGTTTAADWAWWAPSGAQPREEGVPWVGIHEAASGAEHHLAEIDHAALSVFVHAANRPVAEPSFSSPIRRRPSNDCDPIIRTLEQIDRFGAISLFTLNLEEYGEYLIVNGKDPRLNAPPDSRPKPDLHVEFCWSASFGNVFHGWGEMQLPAPDGAVTIHGAPASCLSALVLLLANDLRTTLGRLHPVSIAFSRDVPRYAATFADDGLCWRGDDIADVPPPCLSRPLFLRPDPRGWKGAAFTWSECSHAVPPSPGTPRWTCGVLLRDDLDALAVSPGGPESGHFELSRSLDHLLVLDSPDGEGAFWRVGRGQEGSGLLLRRALQHAPACRRGDGFAGIRRAFLQLARMEGTWRKAGRKDSQVEKWETHG